MSSFRLLLFGVLFIAVMGVLFIPSAAYTMTNLDRGVSSNVTDNDTASEPFLGINGSSSVTENTNNQTLVIVNNTQTINQTVTVSLSSDISNWSLQDGSSSRSKVLVSNENERFAVDVGEIQTNTTANYTVRSEDGIFVFEQTRTVDVVEQTVNPSYGGNASNFIAFQSNETTNGSYHIGASTLDGTVSTGDAHDSIYVLGTGFDKKQPATKQNTSGYYLLNVSSTASTTSVYQLSSTEENDSSVKYRTAHSSDWGGEWNGTTTYSIYYASSGGDVARYAVGSTSPQVVYSSNIVTGVAGSGDVDGDGFDELVVTTNETANGVNSVQYLESDGTMVNSSVSTAYNHTIAIGTPADFDGDGNARVPIVQGNSLYLLNVADGTLSNALATNVSQSHLAVRDVTGDGSLEILYTDTSDSDFESSPSDYYDVKYVDGIEDGSYTISRFTASDGSPIGVTNWYGVA